MELFLAHLGQKRFNSFAHIMIKADVNLLNERRTIGRHVQQDIAIVRHLAASPSGKRNDGESQASCRLSGTDNVC